jgi:hypothetical protein
MFFSRTPAYHANTFPRSTQRLENSDPLLCILQAAHALTATYNPHTIPGEDAIYRTNLHKMQRHVNRYQFERQCMLPYLQEQSEIYREIDTGVLERNPFRTKHLDVPYCWLDGHG